MITLPVYTLAATSLDPKDWKDDNVEEASRQGMHRQLREKAIDAEDIPVSLRRFYPLRARLSKYDVVLGFQAGTVLKYARVKRTPSRFPIEVFFSGKTATGVPRTQVISYNSDEVELLGV